MGSDQQERTALKRARRLVELYQEGRMTEASVISGVAEMITSDNVDEMVALLPPEPRAQLGDWARTLPAPDSSRVVFWALPQSARRSLAEWVTRQEQREEAGPWG